MKGHLLDKSSIPLEASSGRIEAGFPGIEYPTGRQLKLSHNVWLLLKKSVFWAWLLRDKCLFLEEFLVLLTCISPRQPNGRPHVRCYILQRNKASVENRFVFLLKRRVRVHVLPIAAVIRYGRIINANTFATTAEDGSLQLCWSRNIIDHGYRRYVVHALLACRLESGGRAVYTLSCDRCKEGRRIREERKRSARVRTTSMYYF